MKKDINNKKMLLVMRWLPVLMAILYSSWIVGYFLNPQVAQKGIVSELSVYSQPYHWLFIVADYAVAVLTVSLAIVGLMHFSKKNIHRIAWALFGVFGMFTFIAAMLNLQCSPSVEVGCTQGGYYTIHMISGVIAQVSLVISFILSLRSYFPKGTPKYFCYSLIIIWMTLGLISIFAYDMIDSQAIAILQRVAIGVAALMMLMIPGRLFAASQKNTK